MVFNFSWLVEEVMSGLGKVSSELLSRWRLLEL